MWKNTLQSGRPQITVRRMRLHAGYLRLQTHSEYVILLLFHYNNCCTNAPQCYGTRTLSVLLVFRINVRWPISAETCCKQISHIHNKPLVIDGGFSLLFLITDTDRVPSETWTESLATIKRVDTSTFFLIAGTADIYYFTIRRGKKVPLSHL